MGEVYRSSHDKDGDIEGDAIPTATNPMHAAAMKQLEQRERELEASRKELEASKAIIELLRKEMKQYKQQHQEQQELQNQEQLQSVEKL